MRGAWEAEGHRRGVLYVFWGGATPIGLFSSISLAALLFSGIRRSRQLENRSREIIPNGWDTRENQSVSSVFLYPVRGRPPAPSQLRRSGYFFVTFTLDISCLLKIHPDARLAMFSTHSGYSKMAGSHSHGLRLRGRRAKVLAKDTPERIRRVRTLTGNVLWIKDLTLAARRPFTDSALSSSYQMIFVLEGKSKVIDTSCNCSRDTFHRCWMEKHRGQR